VESLKIAIIYELGPGDDGSFLGGIESHILGLCGELAVDHEVTMITGMIPGAASRMEMNGFTIIRSDIMGMVQRSWNPTNLTTSRQLFSIPSFYRVGSGMEADIFHGHIYTSGIVALELAKARRSHCVNTIHGSYYDHWNEITGSWAKSTGYRLAERLLATYLARNCDRQIHTATDFAEKVTNWGGPADKIRVILNGVDTVRFSPSKGDPGEGDKPIIMTVRRLVPKNGVRYFVEACSMVESDAKFVVVGDGPERPYLEELARSLGVADKIEFKGPVPNDLLPEIMGNAEVMVVPSLVEASSISLLEAMAMEKPSIVTNIPGIDEVANPDRSVMIPPADPKNLANAVDSLLADPARRGRLGKNGRGYVLSQRSHMAMARQTLNVYKEALEG
jgi:glycosyltransferase involved in cell wall biosynthesis